MSEVVKEFFVDATPNGFKLFGPLHLFLIMIVFLALLFIYINRKRIANIKHKNLFRYILCFILFLNMMIYYGELIYYGNYTWRNHLPLHFCYISGFSFMYYLLSRKRSVYKIVYFFAFLGPLPAILWPKMESTFNSFIFYQWIISHHVYLIGSFFIYFMDNFRLEKKDIVHTFWVAQFIFITMSIFNAIFGTNYIFSSDLPPYMFELYPILEYINHPIILIELLGLIVLLFAYIPVYFSKKNKV